MSIFAVGPGIPTIHLTECEIYILWTLGEEGPMSIYALASGHKLLRDPRHPPDTKFRCLPEIYQILTPTPNIWEKKVGREQTYDYHFVHTKVMELMEKELIRTQNLSRQEAARVMELTFLGLMFYLQNLKDPDPRKSSDEKRKHAIDFHPKLIPLLKQWNSLTKDLEEERCKRAFAKTVKEFVDIQNVELRVPSASLVFDGFLKRNTPTNSAEVETKVMRERDNEVARCLEKKEMSTLRDCYIAYLAVKDIYQLSEETAENVRFFEGLESEKELAYLEGRNINADSLFNGNRLREFLPKYAGTEYFFTGILVENLLWNKEK